MRSSYSALIFTGIREAGSILVGRKLLRYTMSAHMRTRHIKNKRCEVIVRMPGKKEIYSFIPQMAFKKLEGFLSKYSEEESLKEASSEESIDWREVAKDSFEKYGEAGTYIRGARYREGLSQKKLAELSGVSQENISRIENGKRAVGEQVAKKLARPLQINYKMLL